MNKHWSSCRPNTICFACHHSPWYIISYQHCSASWSFAQSNSKYGLLSSYTQSSRCSPKVHLLWCRGIPQWIRTHLQNLRHLIPLTLISLFKICIELLNHYWKLTNRNYLLMPSRLDFHFRSNKHFLERDLRLFFLLVSMFPSHRMKRILCFLQLVISHRIYLPL